MDSISVYLENGFDHDRVTVSAGGPPTELPEVTTRHQVGLAAVVEPAVRAASGPVPVGQAGRVTVRVEIPARRLVAERAVDPRATPYVRVDVAGGGLVVRAQASPPMFA